MNKQSAIITLIVIMLVSLLGTAGIALPYPVLAPYFLNGEPNSLTSFLGIHPKLLLGAALAVYPLGILIGSSFIGALSDNYGRKSVLLWTLGGSAIGYMITGLAFIVESYPLFLAARLVTGICEGNIAIARAMAADLHPQIDRTRAISLVYTTVYAGWLVGPLTGGYLMYLGAEIVFYVAAGAVIACALLVLITLSSEWNIVSTTKSSIKQPITQSNSIGLLQHAPIRPIIAFYLFYALGLNAFYEFYPVWFVEKFGADSRAISWFTVTLTIAMIAVSALIATPLTRKLGAFRTMVLAALALSLLLFVQPIIFGLSVYAIFALIGGTIAIGNGVISAYLAQNFGHLGQGRVMGLQTTIFCLSSVLIAIFGSLIALLDANYALWLGALLVGFSASLPRKPIPSSVQAATA